jgi:hypothetical protein
MGPFSYLHPLDGPSSAGQFEAPLPSLLALLVLVAYHVRIEVGIELF